MTKSSALALVVVTALSLRTAPAHAGLVTYHFEAPVYSFSSLGQLPSLPGALRDTSALSSETISGEFTIDDSRPDDLLQDARQGLFLDAVTSLTLRIAGYRFSFLRNPADPNVFSSLYVTNDFANPMLADSYTASADGVTAFGPEEIPSRYGIGIRYFLFDSTATQLSSDAVPADLTTIAGSRFVLLTFSDLETQSDWAIVGRDGILTRVPEPTTLGLLALGLIGVLATRTRRTYTGGVNCCDSLLQGCGDRQRRFTPTGWMEA